MNFLKSAPRKDEIDQMPGFEGLNINQVFVVTNDQQANTALIELSQAGAVGFDTESKPTFRKGEKSTGPHLLQFATLHKAFIFQSQCIDSHPAIFQLLKDPHLIKIGFGLNGDLDQIFNRFRVTPSSIVDLDRSFKKMGFCNSLGAKSAIALLFQRKFLKSKSVTTSNWAADQLSDRQLLYAANDAYAAIRIYHALLNKQSQVSIHQPQEIHLQKA